jgi:hypothetical protein
MPPVPPQTSLPLRAESRLLLARAGVPALPSPVALQLLDIPFVLPLKQLPERVDGLLPGGRTRCG